MFCSYPYLSLASSSCNRNQAGVLEASYDDAEIKIKVCVMLLCIILSLCILECRTLTITSFKSFVCKWCNGSKKFCFTLSSNEYLLSAICFKLSPISIKAWARKISGYRTWKFIASFSKTMKLPLSIRKQ